MSKIKIFSFFLIILVLLITGAYLLSPKKEFVKLEVFEQITQEVKNIIKPNDKFEEANEVEPIDNSNQVENLEINNQDEMEDLVDHEFTPEGSSPTLIDEEALKTDEIGHLNTSADLAENFVLNHPKYSEDNGFNLIIINASSNDCENCWFVELVYEIENVENYFKTITINFENQQITEVIWGGEILDF
ncbi:MAG: hypothetical protein HOC78_02195 [Candidatus Komeilibacteria bacterium]|jgi:hypothetical protein|nr:hypothetical protein [Candidatus Komeilibacteria bacterium]